MLRPETAKDRRALELFEAVCDLTPDERARVLTDACDRDAHLRSKVESLLGRDGDESDSFSETELTLHRVHIAPLFDDRVAPAIPKPPTRSVRAFQTGCAVAGGERDAHGAWIRNGKLAFSPDGTRVFALLTDGSIGAWDFATGEALERMTEHGPYIELSTECEGRLAATTTDGRAVLWDVASEAPSVLEERHLGRDVSHLELASDGTLLAGGPGLARVTTAGVQPLDERNGFTWSTFRGAEVLAVQGRRRVVRYEDGARTTECALFALQLAIAPDLGSIAFCDGSTDAYVLDADALVVSAVLPGHPDPISSCAFDPSGNRLVVGSPSCVRVLHVASGNELARLPLNMIAGKHLVSGLRFDPSGEFVVASRDGSILAWHVVED